MAFEQKITGYKKGLLAESYAAVYMISKGYKVLEKRFKTPHGEVDLILKKGQTLIFVEVKFRAHMDDAAYAITAKNQERVRNTAMLYLQKYPEYTTYDIRFDALVLSKGAWPRHIENAF